MNNIEEIKEARTRFEKLVIKQDGCWSWKKPGKSKYKLFYFRKKKTGAHRASWIIYKGEIPDGLIVCHKCDNPTCTNPDHLFLGTYQDNMDDMHKKGRSRLFPKKVVNEKGNTRLSVDMDREMHRDLKIISARKNCPMRKLVIRALVAFIRFESKFN